MQKPSIISTPSIANTNSLYATWKAMPGNGSATELDFYSFLTVASVDRAAFLSSHTDKSFDDVKGRIVIPRLIPK